MRHKILVCGASDFVTRHVTKHFANSEHLDVHALRFEKPSFHCANVKWHLADIRQPQTLEAIVDGMDFIIQTEAMVPTNHTDAIDKSIMHSHLFRAAFERQVKHVIFLRPSSEFPLKTKNPIEKLCQEYTNRSQTKFTVIRHSMLYGPFEQSDIERDHLFSKILNNIMTADDKVTVWGTGEEEIDLIYIDDLISLVELCMDKQDNPYRVYHCGSAEPIRMKTLVQMLISASKKNVIIEHNLSKQNQKRNVFFNFMLAKEELAWKPKISLKEGIKKTMAWWNEQQVIQRMEEESII